AEDVVDGGGDLGDVIGRIGEDTEGACLALSTRDCFFDIFLIEINRAGWPRAGIDSANGEFEIDGIDRALEDDAVTEFPAIFGSQLVVDDDAGAIALPGEQLVGRQLK